MAMVGLEPDDVSISHGNDLRKTDTSSGANSGAFPTGSSEGIENAKSLAGRLASLDDAERNALIALLLSGNGSNKSE